MLLNNRQIQGTGVNLIPGTEVRLCLFQSEQAYACRVRLWRADVPDLTVQTGSFQLQQLGLLPGREVHDEPGWRQMNAHSETIDTYLTYLMRCIATGPVRVVMQRLDPSLGRGVNFEVSLGRSPTQVKVRAQAHAKGHALSLRHFFDGL